MARSASVVENVFRDDDVVEATRADIAAPERRGLKVWFIKIYTWSAILTFPLLILALVALVVSSNPAPKTAGDQASSTATSSAGRTAATRAIQQWLAAKPSPLPGGQILSWDGAKILPAPSQASGDAGLPVTYKTEIDSFTLVDGRGNNYSVSVQVALDPRGGGAQALAGPSLGPVIPPASDQWASGGPWPGLNPRSDVSTSVQTAVNGWAQAYASGSADSLRLAVGDGTASHTYLPLSGVSTVNATVNYLATYGGPGTVIAQVSLTLLWQGQKVDPTQTKNVDAPATTMDLLIERADSGAPVVTAWGAPGSGPALRDYGNAVAAPSIPAPSASSTP